MSSSQFTSVEFCAGAGGQALGLEQAGYRHLLLVDNDSDCCRTLVKNRPDWRVECADMNAYDPPELGPVDLFAAGLPCPPFSIAGRKLGENDERNLFPAAFRLIKGLEPRAVLIENVRGFLSSSFKPYRDEIFGQFRSMGYEVDHRLYDAKDFGVPQTRSRVAIVALKRSIFPYFEFPSGAIDGEVSVGEALRDLMAANGWKRSHDWSVRANAVAPTIVGGSKKHGGPDLGPSRARAAWKEMGVNGGSIALDAPEPDFSDLPRLTTRMVARLQGFPDEWVFTGTKTASYRQVGNAFPPPVARALGSAIRDALRMFDSRDGAELRLAAE